MKTILFITILLIIGGNTFAQVPSPIKKDKLLIEIDSSLLRRLLKREFTQMYSPNTKNGVGNYASMDILESRVNFSGNIILKKDIISIQASGGVSDGLISFFSNNKWSNNIGLDVQYNLLHTQKKNYIILDVENYLKYDADQKGNNCSKWYNECQNDCSQLPLKKNELAVVEAKYNVDSVKLSDYKNKLTPLNGNISIVNKLELAEYYNAFLNDSIQRQCKRLELEKYNCRCDSLRGLSNNFKEYQKLRTRNRKNKALDDLSNSLAVLGFQMNWFSFGYGVSNNSFRLFDPTQTFDKQFTPTSFLTQEIRAQYNWYKKHKIERSYFLSLWVKGSIRDNFESLEKNDFEEINTDTSSTTVRRNIKKFSAYSGNYEKNLYNLTFGLDWYWFMTGNTMAFHLYPKYSITQNLQPETGLGVGILVPFRKTNQEKTIINAEIYMNNPDVFKTNGITETNYFRRSEYGIRFTAPIQFN